MKHTRVIYQDYKNSQHKEYKIIMNRYINKKSLSLLYAIGFTNKLIKSIWVNNNITDGIVEGILSGMFWPLNENHYVKWSDIISNKNKKLIRLNNTLDFWKNKNDQYPYFDYEVQYYTSEIRNHKE